MQNFKVQTDSINTVLAEYEEVIETKFAELKSEVKIENSIVNQALKAELKVETQAILLRKPLSERDDSTNNTSLDRKFKARKSRLGKMRASG